jgi:TonB family protein
VHAFSDSQWHRDCAIPARAGKTSSGEGLLFALLPSPQSRWKSLVTGWGVQALSLVTLVIVCARFHQNLIPLANYRVTNLVSYEPLVLPQNQPMKAPTLVRSRPQVESKAPPERKPALESPTQVAALVVAPQVKAIVEHKPSEPEPAAPALKLDNKMPVMPSAPTSQIVAVGTFSHESPVTAPVAKLGASVQPVGFGNAAGNGSGHDHGTGAANPNVVMSSGFGNGAIEAFTSPSTHSKAGLRQPSNGPNAPVEITFKPKPDYTDEGRQQKINGEVRLEVVFKSDGRVNVLRVVQGLGHGLDEQAVKAAEQIKFKPALHEGQPIDSMALVHIIFELIS